MDRVGAEKDEHELSNEDLGLRHRPRRPVVRMSPAGPRRGLRQERRHSHRRGRTRRRARAHRREGRGLPHDGRLHSPTRMRAERRESGRCLRAGCFQHHADSQAVRDDPVRAADRLLFTAGQLAVPDVGATVSRQPDRP